MKCNFCGLEGRWKSILKDHRIEKKDESEIVLCYVCMDLWLQERFTEIDLKMPQSTKLKNNDYNESDYEKSILRHSRSSLKLSDHIKKEDDPIK